MIRCLSGAANGTTHNTCNFKTLAPNAITATIPSVIVDTSSLSVSQLDARVWPTPCLASRSKVEIAAQLAQTISATLSIDMKRDLLFGMVEGTKKGDEHEQYCLSIPHLKLVDNLVEFTDRISNAFNVFQCLQKMWVKGQDVDVALTGLAPYRATGITLCNGVRLVGSRPL